MKLIKASLSTRHFEFEAYGSTDNGARNALIAAFKKHAMQSKMTPDWWEELADCIEYREIAVGRAYRDREPL